MAAPAEATGAPLLEFREVKKHFRVAGGKVVRALDGVSLTVPAGRTLGIVGESGCGKTTLSKVALLLEAPTAGQVLFKGTDASRLDRRGWRSFRSSVQAVFQDPWSSLNPRMKILDIVMEPVLVNSRQTRAERQARAVALMGMVGLPEAHLARFPHELSGGQRQRVAIARALSLNPSLIVLDEPVSSLDVSIRSQVMNLLKDLQEQHGFGYLLIGHHLATVAYVSQQIAVMYLGKVVELRDSAGLISDPKHPYTRGLLAASLASHPSQRGRTAPIGGEVPSPIAPPSGCRFHTRCPYVMPVCSKVEPPLAGAGGALVACHLYDGAQTPALRPLEPVAAPAGAGRRPRRLRGAAHPRESGDPEPPDIPHAGSPLSRGRADERGTSG